MLTCCFKSCLSKSMKRDSRQKQQQISLHVKNEEIKNEVKQENLPKPNEIWKHVQSNQVYIIHSVGNLKTKVQSLNMQSCAIYTLQNEHDGIKTLLIRPLCDFLDTINGKSRFEKVLLSMPVSLSFINTIEEVAEEEDEEDGWQFTKPHESISISGLKKSE